MNARLPVMLASKFLPMHLMNSARIIWPLVPCNVTHARSRHTTMLHNNACIAVVSARTIAIYNFESCTANKCLRNMSSKTSRTAPERISIKSSSPKVPSPLDSDSQEFTEKNEDGVNLSSTVNKRVARLSKEDYEESILQSVFVDLAAVARPMTGDEWLNVGTRISESLKRLKPIWPTIILNMLAHKTTLVPGLFDVGMSLFEYINRRDIVTLSAAVSLCVHQGGPAHRDQALKFYDELRSISGDLLDSMTSLLLINALSKTVRWRECLALIDVAKLSSPVSSSFYCPIVAAAIRTGDDALAEDLCNLLVSSNYEPTDELFLAMLKAKGAVPLLKMMERYGWIASKTVAALLKDHFESMTAEKWTGQFAKATSSGRCSGCNARLRAFRNITAEQFTRLKETFLTKSLIKGDVFMNSTPEEVKQFQTFLKKQKPFDVIIDALNVAHVTHRNSPAQHKDYMLTQVIRYFARDKRVLLLGRHHMKQWKSYKLASTDKTNNIAWFTTENISADDPFMLYGALHSGPTTCIVTSDQLRDHRFLLGAELAQYMRVWQRGHQIAFKGLVQPRVLHESVVDPLRFKWPDVHDTRVQCADGAWHVPYKEEELLLSYELTRTWLCLQEK